MFSPWSLRSLVSMRTGESSFYAVIPDQNRFGNDDFCNELMMPCKNSWDG